MRRLALILFWLFSLNTFAQKEGESIFSLDSFLLQVKNHHPVAIQANLQLQVGDASLQKARGLFDPKLQSDIAQKYFDGKEYYDLGESTLKVPTWFGIELQGGYERNQGVFLNPENNVPNAGLWFAGISVPIGEGLFIDERRAELQKAKSIIEQTEAQRELILNELFLSAGLVYWDWFRAYHNLEVYIEAFDLAKQRFDAVKQSAVFGDAPYIDTLEAGIQLQNRILNLNEAQLNFKNATAFLSIFLWDKGIIPLEIADGVIPEALDTEGSDNLEIQEEIDSILIDHPELRKSQAKIDQLVIEERWSREQLKPKLNLKYNPITEAIADDPISAYTTNNYSWGLQFEFPLLLRKERGKLNLVKIKKNENILQLENKREQLNFKVEAAINEFETTRIQITLYRRTVVDYFGLLEGERQLFNNGESSLFLVNSRELGFINAQIKLIELVTKNRDAVLKLEFALGRLNEKV